LNSLREQGVAIAGRLVGINDGKAQFSGSLGNVCALADLKMKRLLRAIDEFIADDNTVPPAETFAETKLDRSPVLLKKLGGDSIKTVIWATGFRPDYSWLDVPVLDRKGQIKHDGGVVEAPGMYVLGLPMMRTRKSSFIFGAQDDAAVISDHLHDYLNSLTRSDTDVVYQNHSRESGYRRSA
jgi:putative flavoprotein involved in K+ transport